MFYTMDVTSLVAAKQDLGVGKQMQGGDSLQSFLLTLQFVLFVSMCAAKSPDAETVKQTFKLQPLMQKLQMSS